MPAACPCGIAAFIAPIAIGYLLPSFGLRSVFFYFSAIAFAGGVVSLTMVEETAGKVLDQEIGTRKSNR
jgi:hypothetical protein